MKARSSATRSIIRETDQRYNRTCSRYAFVPASPTCLRDVDPASKSARSVLRISRARVDDTDIKRGRLTEEALSAAVPPPTEH
jgi:hypothetical protein